MSNAFAKKKRNAFSLQRTAPSRARRDRVSYAPQHSTRRSHDPVERTGNWGRRITVALAVIVIGSAVYLLFISNVFRIFSVTIAGNHAVSAKEITTLLNQESSGKWLGIFSRHNLLLENPHTTEQLLRTKFPELATVMVTKSFISGGKWRPELAVQVTERQIFGIWCNAQGNSPQQNKIFQELSTGATAPQNFTATANASSPAATPFSTAGTINVFRDFYQSMDLMSAAMSAAPSTAAQTAFSTASVAASPPPSSVNCFYFDQGGVIFQSAPQPAGYLIFTIFNISSQNFVLGDDPISSTFIKDVSDIDNYLQNFDALRPLYAISNSDNPNFVAIKVMPNNNGQSSAAGFYVFLDLHADYHAALANLTTALGATLKSQLATLNYVDLRVPGRLYYATNP